MITVKPFDFNKIKIFLVYAILVNLLLSRFLLSLSQILLILVWIIEGNLKSKFSEIFKDKAVLAFILFFIVTLSGLIYTSDLEHGFNDLKIKLPMLVLPVILPSIIFTKKDVKHAFYYFILAIFIKSISSIYIFFTNEITDTRQLSSGISHIRFSLIVNMAIYICLFILFSSYFIISKIEKICLFSFAIWFSIFLFIIQSLTGIVIFLIIYYLLICFLAFKIQKKIKKTLLLSLSFLFPLIFLSYIFYSFYDFYNVAKISFSNLPEKTSQGNDYSHDTLNLQLENKNYIFLNICDKELRDEWNKISNINYDSLDNNGNPIKFTLIRYLTSKGQKKDSAGVKNLNNSDIKNIEKGLANYLFANKLSMYSKLYQIIWQIDAYIKTGNTSGYSLIQRIVYFRIGWSIFTENVIFGVGTGDIKNAYFKKYDSEKTQLPIEQKRLCHNQYLTNLVKFGIIGFVISFFALIFPFVKNKKFNEFLPIIFMLIFFISMINEDTLQTQTGVNFITVFYCLFILNKSFFNEEINVFRND